MSALGSVLASIASGLWSAVYGPELKAALARRARRRAALAALAAQRAAEREESQRRARAWEQYRAQAAARRAAAVAELSDEERAQYVGEPERIDDNPYQ